MDIGSLRRSFVLELASAGIDRPFHEADLLLCEILRRDRGFLLAHLDETFPPSDLDRAREGLLRRLGREPMAYILGRASFGDLDLRVGPGCLVPRPETEILVETSLSLWSEGPFLDWGTGSGVIALSLLHSRPEAEGFAVEAEPSALRWAWANLKEYGLLSRCVLLHEARLDALSLKEGSLGLVVSNPPYIPTEDLKDLMDDVRLYEPSRALDGGSGGLDPYRGLLPWAARALRPGGFLVVEHGGEAQRKALLEMASPSLENVAQIDDLAGRPRVLAWKRLS